MSGFKVNTVTVRPSELRALLAVRAERKAERASILSIAQLEYKGNMTRDAVGAVEWRGSR